MANLDDSSVVYSLGCHVVLCVLLHFYDWQFVLLLTGTHWPKQEQMFPTSLRKAEGKTTAFPAFLPSRWGKLL